MALITISKLHVDTFVRVMHVNIAEGDVFVERAADGTNCETETTGIYTFKEHIRGPILSIYTVILVPNSAIMNPYVVPRNIEAISIEGSDVYHAMPIFIRPASADINIPHFQSINIMHPERPIW